MYRHVYQRVYLPQVYTRNGNKTSTPTSTSVRPLTQSSIKYQSQSTKYQIPRTKYQNIKRSEYNFIQSYRSILRVWGRLANSEIRGVCLLKGTLLFVSRNPPPG